MSKTNGVMERMILAGSGIREYKPQVFDRVETISAESRELELFMALYSRPALFARRA